MALSHKSSVPSVMPDVQSRPFGLCSNPKDENQLQMQTGANVVGDSRTGLKVFADKKEYPNPHPSLKSKAAFSGTRVFYRALHLLQQDRERALEVLLH